MIVVERRRLFFIFGILAVVLIPFLFLAFPPLPLPAAAVPPILAGEALLYILFSWAHNPQGGLRAAGVAALILLAARLALNMLGSIILCLSPDYSFGSAWLTLHLGNPLAMLVQMFALLALAPHLFYLTLPGLLSDQAALQLAGADHPAERAEHPAASTPLGGVMQVSSYEELSEFFRKIIGLEGFMLYSDEGLNLWSNFEFHINEDAAAAATNQLTADIFQWSKRLRLHQTDSMFFRTEEHGIFNLILTERVSLLLIFKAEARMEDIMPRIEMLRRTAREFLRSRGDMR